MSNLSSLATEDVDVPGDGLGTKCRTVTDKNGTSYLTVTRRSVEHCTLHADGAWLNELGWSQ